MDIDPDSTGPPLSSQPDLLSRSNKRPKEDDEMSTPLQDAKRRRSPPIVSQKSPPPDFNDAKSAIPSTPPQEHLPRNAVGSDIAADSTYSLVEYAQEESTGHPAPRLLKDLETRAITVAQLIQEVKGIYAGLGKCITSPSIMSTADICCSHGREKVYRDRRRTIKKSYQAYQRAVASTHRPASDFAKRASRLLFCFTPPCHTGP